jgi:hypothetical protein
MPRKPKKKPAGQTYFKSKNNRWYKKIQVDGKTRCRFVSKAEVEGAATVPKKKASNPKPAPSAGSSSQTSSQPPKPQKPKRRRRKKSDVASAD